MLLCSGCVDEEGSSCLESRETSGNCLCGPSQLRMRTWTTAEWENPLRQFLDWLIIGLGRARSCKTYAVAHYGG